jgi:hypothetical protein
MSIATILRQTAEAEGFRHIVERHHLTQAADEIERLTESIDRLQRAIDKSPFHRDVPTCPECDQPYEANYAVESVKINCDCGWKFEARRHIISLPLEMRD